MYGPFFIKVGGTAIPIRYGESMMNQCVFWILIYVCMSTCGHLLLRIGAKSVSSSSADGVSIIMFFQSAMTEWRIVLGLFLWCGAAALWIWIVSRTPLSFAYCVSSLTYILIPLLSVWLFNESVSWLKSVGILLIAVGVCLSIASSISIPVRNP